MDYAAGNVDGIPVEVDAATESKSSISSGDELYLRLLQSDLGGIIVWKLSGEVKSANRCFLRMTGYTEADLQRGLALSDISPRQSQEYDEALFATLRERGSVPLHSRELIARDRTVLPVLVRSVMLPGSKDEAASLVLSNAPGERTSAAAEFERDRQRHDSQRLEAIGRLAGGVAHEFNNMLMIILSNVQLAQEELGEGEPARQRLSEVVQACDRAADLTQQLLAFGRRQIQRLEVCDVGELGLEMLRFAHRLIGEDFETDFVSEGELGAILADRGQMKQLLLSFFLHGRDAMPDGGKITLKIGRHQSEVRTGVVPPGKFVMLEIADNGPGMDEETKSRVFEPFFTSMKLGTGTGLGLASAYGLIKQNDGYVEVNSEAGEGTTFRIYFPEIEPGNQREETEGELKNWGGSEMILLVEDEDALRSAVKTFLELRGFRVLEARNGEEGCAACAGLEAEIDLILTDVVMPKLGGLDMVKKLRKSRPDFPAIFMSGYAESPAFDNPQDGLLIKPFNMQTLTAELRKRLATTPQA